MKTIKFYIGYEDDLRKLGCDTSSMTYDWPGNTVKVDDAVYQLRTPDTSAPSLRVEDCLVGTFEELEKHISDQGWSDLPSCTIKHQLDHYRSKGLSNFCGAIFVAPNFDKINFYIESTH